MKKVVGVACVSVALGLLSQSCSSDSGGKKVGSTFHPDAGAGDAGEGGTSTSTGGHSGSGGAGNSGGSGGSGGSIDMSGGGESNAGASGAGPECPTGFGECDGDPSVLCEQDLSLVTSCGSCTTTCNSTHGTAACVDQKCVLTCATGFDDCDGDPGTGCEAPLNDNANCGACGRDCAALGATCMVDKCSAITMHATSDGSDSGGDRTWAFSDLGILHAGNFNYAITRYPLDGTAPLTIWQSTNKSTSTQGLLVMGTDAYWPELGTGVVSTGGVYKKAITAPAATLKTLVFVPEWSPAFLRQQGNALYWASGSNGDAGAWIYSRNVAATAGDPGTKIVTVDQGVGGISAFNVTSNALYWVTSTAGTGKSDELRTTPLAGGTPTAVPEVFPGLGTPINAETAGTIAPVLLPVLDTIYFTRNVGDAQDGIYSFKTGDAKPTQLVAADGVTTMVLDSTSIYYAQRNVSNLYKAPITGGAGTSIMSTSGVSRIVGQDAKFVYYVVSGCCAGVMYKVIK